MKLYNKDIIYYKLQLSFLDMIYHTQSVIINKMKIVVFCSINIISLFQCYMRVRNTIADLLVLFSFLKSSNNLCFITSVTGRTNFFYFDRGSWSRFYLYLLLLSFEHSVEDPV